jgi:Protein of unknown function C-terminus (DUF2399)
MSGLKDALTKALTNVTKDFVRAKRRAAARDSDYLSDEQIERLRDKEEKENEIKPAAYAAMAEAYRLASANGTLPANARQIMYQARPLVLAAIDGKCWKKSSYFTQTLLPDYVSEHPIETADWDVVYDARGHFVEPHVRQKLGIGTLEVRSYINSWSWDDDEDTADLNVEINELYPTSGPTNRYKFALFIEKEGFNPLLDRSQIAKKYDLAIFSSKGQSTTAARRLVDALSQAGVTILVAHDFDVSGLSIVHNLGHDTRRYSFDNEPTVIDLGLRLPDVEGMDLQSEPVVFKQQKDPGDKLLDYDDVTAAEIAFLIDGCAGSYNQWWRGKRVELNAMTSDQFITWLEKKLQEHGVKKVVPDSDILAIAWQRADRVSGIQDVIDEIDEEFESDETTPVPKDLGAQVRKRLSQKPELSWDQALVLIAAERKVKR